MNKNESPLHARDVDYPEPNRWELLRDVFVFQIKLAIDGFRDLLLVPISLIAALVDLVTPQHRAGQHFYDVVLLGRRSEKWINLFGAANRVLRGHEPVLYQDEPRLDDLVSRMEKMLVEQYENGSVTASAKGAIDKVLDSVQKRRSRGE